jgi:transcriptional regulator with XRE-family HTH domain
MRIDAGLMREELAERLNVVPAQIDRWENGSDPVDVIVLREWARACDASFMAVATRLDEALASGARQDPKPTEQQQG